MKFISEQIINEMLASVDGQKDVLQSYLQEFGKTQVDGLAFVSSENLDLLTEEEYDILVFIILIIWKSIEKEYVEMVSIPGEIIEANDEENWEVYNMLGSRNFSKVLDTYFSDYQQEDLLAFVEDTIQNDEDSELSQVGREIIFISCKSFIDAAHEEIK